MAYANFSIVTLKLRSSRAESNWPLRATVGQNSSSVQMAATCHVGGAVLVHVARSGRLDAALDERSFNLAKCYGKLVFLGTRFFIMKGYIVSDLIVSLKM